MNESQAPRRRPGRATGLRLVEMGLRSDAVVPEAMTEPDGPAFRVRP